MTQLLCLIQLCVLLPVLAAASQLVRYEEASGSSYVAGLQVRVARAAPSNNSNSSSTPAAEAAATVPAPTAIYKDEHTYYEKHTILHTTLAAFLRAEFDRVFASTTPTQHGQLNNAHRLALQQQLSFDFNFYGHTVNKVTIATGGFLYLNDFLHPYIAHSQYVAPLMANFDTLNSSSIIKWVDAGNSFWVRWEKLLLNNNRSLGEFTFQCVLYANGTIVFDYISLPLSVSDMAAMSAGEHYVKVGVSDAYYYDSVEGGRLIRRIYSYHTVAVNFSQVKEDTVFRLVPLPTCNTHRDCTSCVSRAYTPNFSCSWCADLNRCSSGLDRDRQKWELNNCHTQSITDAGKCVLNKNPGEGEKDSRVGAGPPEAGKVLLGLFITFILCAAIGGVVFFFVYAYRNPSSGPGMWLIEHRPARLRERLANIRFSRSSGAAGDNYKVTVDEGDESMA